MKDKEEIFLDLIRKNNDRIYRIIWSFANSTADRDDLYQNILLKVWNGIEKFRQKSQATTWLYRITLNACIDFRRSEKIGHAVLSEQLDLLDLKGETDIEHEYIENEKLAVLHRCIKSLSTIEKTLLTLYLEDIKYGTIGSIVGISEKNVAVKISRIKKKLNKMISEDGNNR